MLDQEAAPKRADQHPCREGAVVDPKRHCVGALFAEGAGVGFLLGGDDVGDFGEEGYHGDGEAEADYGAEGA